MITFLQLEQTKTRLLNIYSMPQSTFEQLIREFVKSELSELDDEELQPGEEQTTEMSGVAAGAGVGSIVGYTLPLGMKPNRPVGKELGRNSKKKT